MVGSIVDKIYTKKNPASFLLNASIFNGFVVALPKTISLFLAHVQKNLARVAQFTSVAVYYYYTLRLVF